MDTKKILIAFNATQFSEGAFEFARHINEMQPILLAGVFIPQVSYANLWSYTGAMAGPAFVPIMEEEQPDLVDKNIERFAHLCQKNGIAYRVHKDFYDFALPELKRETRFADVIIISSEKFNENLIGGDPAEYMSNAIHASECPVIVVPEKFEFPKANVIAYDGSASSVFAIKQFAYLFPELCANETLLAYVKDDHNIQLPYEHHIEELATQHFRDLQLSKLEIDPKKHFNLWLRDKERVILVTGSFGRSPVSHLFRKSFVSEIISEHKFPVFIAHR